MSAFRYPRVATMLLCVPLLSLGCQLRFHVLSEDEVAIDSSSADALATAHPELASLSRVRADLGQQHRPGSLLPSQAFGPEAWREHLGVQGVGNVPSLPSDIDQILDRSCTFWPGKKVRDTHVLVLVPSEVDGVPYTLDKLGELIQPHFPYNGEGYGYYDSDTKTQLGSVSPPAPCWVLLTRDVIPGTRGRGYESQQNLLVAHASRTGLDYCLPSTLEASTAILAHYARSSERLFSDAPWTYTRCQDLMQWSSGRYPAAVGGFDSSGLYLNDCICHYHHAPSLSGVSGCRKFF